MAHEAIKEYIYSIHEPVFSVSHVEWEETRNIVPQAVQESWRVLRHFFLLGFLKKRNPVITKKNTEYSSILMISALNNESLPFRIRNWNCSEV